MSSTKIHKKNLIIFTAVAVAMVAFLVLTHNRLAINPTPSNQYTLFWLTENKPDGPVEVQRGGYYVWNVSHPLVLNGKPALLVKMAQCMPGDMLETKDLEYYCNGKSLGRAKLKSSSGLDTAPFLFTGIVPAGKIFAMGHYYEKNGVDQSFDSRYFGFFDVKEIRYAARALI